VARLRRSDASRPGITRVRRGSAFGYVDAAGNEVSDPDVMARIEALVIPPAWEDVWISPHHNGHIQAMGTDAAKRRQYRYHEEWRKQRDLEKFDHVLTIANDLQALRFVVADHLRQEGLTEQRVLACAARLLDIGFFRIGSEEYAEVNGSFGLATIRREHTAVDGDVVTFDYRAKSGKQTFRPILDPLVAPVLRELLERPDDPNPELLAFWDPALGDDGKVIGWTDVKSWDINRYLQEHTGGADISAKDFRTWSATVLCAIALAVSEKAVTSPTAVKKAIVRAVQETAQYLGNTPAVCRASYIHPRVIDLFSGGVTIAEDIETLGEDPAFGQLAHQGPPEDAVLEMLRNPQASRAAKRKQRMLEAAATRSSRGTTARKAGGKQADSKGGRKPSARSSASGSGTDKDRTATAA
jgi:DNA topoisomerase-1